MALAPDYGKISRFLKAVEDRGLDPTELSPIVSDVTGELTVTIMRNGEARTFASDADWVSQAIDVLETGVWDDHAPGRE